jgi:hypothetical protein
MGTAVVRAMLSPWKDACTSDDVLLGIIFPPVYLWSKETGQASACDQLAARDAHRIDEVLSNVAHVIVH